MPIRGSSRVEDDLLRFFGGLCCDGAEQLLRKPLNGPIRTKRSGEQIDD